MILSIDGEAVFIDDADFELVGGETWRIRVSHRSRYAYSKRPGFMHRVILGTPPAGQVIDHINGNGLDNRRANLRYLTRSANQQNGPKRTGSQNSRFRGVSFVRDPRTHAVGRPWAAMIHPRGKAIPLGYFASEEEAARAYDAAAVEHYGPLAYVNLPVVKR